MSYIHISQNYVNSTSKICTYACISDPSPCAKRLKSKPYQPYQPSGSPVPTAGIRRRRQQDPEIKISLSCVVRLCIKIQRNQQQQQKNPQKLF